MIKNLQKHGNSKAVILTQDMLSHLGVNDTVEIKFESDRLVITAPNIGALKQMRSQDFHDAAADTFAQYDVALKNLAK